MSGVRFFVVRTPDGLHSLAFNPYEVGFDLSTKEWAKLAFITDVERGVREQMQDFARARGYTLLGRLWQTFDPIAGVTRFRGQGYPTEAVNGRLPGPGYDADGRETWEYPS